LSEREHQRVIFQEINDILKIMSTPVVFPLMFSIQEEDMIAILAVQSNWRMIENASKQSHGNQKVAPHRQ